MRVVVGYGCVSSQLLLSRSGVNACEYFQGVFKAASCTVSSCIRKRWLGLFHYFHTETRGDRAREKQ